MFPPPLSQGVPEGVEDNGSLTRVAAFPIGIEPERFAEALEDVDVRANISQLLEKYAGRKVSDASMVMDHSEVRNESAKNMDAT